MINKIKLEDYDYNLLKEKGLVEDNGFTEKFYNVYTVYYKLFQNYIDRLLNLGGYDIKLKRSDIPIKPIDIDSKDFELKLSYMYYFYINNILHIEKLSDTNIETLNKMYKSNRFMFNKSIFDFIDKTYQKVTMDDNNKTVELLLLYAFNPDKNLYSSYDDLINNVSVNTNKTIEDIKKEKEYERIKVEFVNKGFDEETINKLEKAYKVNKQ